MTSVSPHTVVYHYDGRKSGNKLQFVELIKPTFAYSNNTTVQRENSIPLHTLPSSVQSKIFKIWNEPIMPLFSIYQNRVSFRGDNTQ